MTMWRGVDCHIMSDVGSEGWRVRERESEGVRERGSEGAGVWMINTKFGNIIPTSEAGPKKLIAKFIFRQNEQNRKKWDGMKGRQAKSFIHSVHSSPCQASRFARNCSFCLKKQIQKRFIFSNLFVVCRIGSKNRAGLEACDIF